MNQPKMKSDKAHVRILAGALANANRFRRFGAGLGAVLFGAICVMSPSPAKAECRQWDVSGQWKLQQGDLVVFVHLRQSDKTISGTARYTRTDSFESKGGNFGANEKRTHNGSVAGTVGAGKITLDMDWDDGSGGIYRGVIGATGMIKGTVIVDKNNPSKTWPWHSMQAMTCADAGAKPTPSVGLGLPPPKSTAPAAPAQPKPREDPILAAKPLLVIPPAGRDYGHAHLSWDAGIRHSNAELWLKVDNGSWTVAAKQAKDSYRPFKIERGKTYVFSLRDGSGELRTVTVRCQPSADDTAEADDASGSPSAAPAQPSPKRLIKSSGKARTETSAPAGVPRIAAFNKPGQASTQVLMWDAGPDHPYAEVWVKVDGADETKVVEQGKGTREMTVEAGKTYQYILTDSGQQLATTTTKAK